MKTSLQEFLTIIFLLTHELELFTTKVSLLSEKSLTDLVSLFDKVGIDALYHLALQVKTQLPAIPEDADNRHPLREIYDVVVFCEQAQQALVRLEHQFTTFPRVCREGGKKLNINNSHHLQKELTKTSSHMFKPAQPSVKRTQQPQSQPLHESNYGLG